jgi:hypothetical protein
MPCPQEPEGKRAEAEEKEGFNRRDAEDQRLEEAERIIANASISSSFALCASAPLR